MSTKTPTPDPTIELDRLHAWIAELVAVIGKLLEADGDIDRERIAELVDEVNAIGDEVEWIQNGPGPKIHT